MADNIVYDVVTDLDPKTLTAIAAETYRKWLEWALGKGEIGGKTLAHPSGRYAASLSWKRTGVSSVAIIANESIAPEALWLEKGTTGANMKEIMLRNAPVSADGYRYRIIPIRNDGTITGGADRASIVGNAQTGERLGGRVGRMWTKPRAAVDASHMVVMTDRPGSADWKIPPMPAYAPAKILSDLLRQEYGKSNG